METSAHRPQLPALSHLDIDQVKREDDTLRHQHHHHQHARTAAPPQPLLPPVTSNSPTYHPPGPPPPYNYSNSHQPSSWSDKIAGVHTPPDSRRTSGDDVEGIKPTSRQALPSISDVLGVDKPSVLANLPPTQESTHTSHPLSQNNPSPSPTSRSFPGVADSCIVNIHSTTSTSSTTIHTPYQHDRSWVAGLSSREQRPKILAPLQKGPQPHRGESLTTHRLQIPVTSAGSLSGHRTSSVPYEHGGPSHTVPVNGSTPVTASSASVPYGYTPYTPRPLSASLPNHNTNSGPIYQPSLTSQAPASWSTETGTSKYITEDRHPNPAGYGDSVKRHLDFFDLENALNEIAAASGILADFSRRYGDRLHQTTRVEPDMKSLPGLVELDDMISKSRVQLDSLVRIRDVVTTQQAAYDQQAADQRQRKAFDDHAAATNQDANAESADAKTNFINADNKKRRGRAAPPGRCHSCNRAETPEWRRGPDGARTLCNACGLHYAKLTRKQQGTSKNVNVGSSNLRPKSSLPDT